MVDEVLDDPAVLTDCEAARFEPAPGGGYRVVDATSSSLVARLGLRNGDIVRSINGRDLNNAKDVATQLGQLWLGGQVTKYSLKLIRAGASKTLNYAVVP